MDSRMAPLPDPKVLLQNRIQKMHLAGLTLGDWMFAICPGCKKVTTITHPGVLPEFKMPCRCHDQKPIELGNHEVLSAAFLLGGFPGVWDLLEAERRRVEEALGAFERFTRVGHPARR